MKFHGRVELNGKTATGIEVPADLAVALDTDPAVRRAFDALSYSQQLRYVQPVEDAKAAATRQRRIDKVLSDLRAG